MVITHRAGSSPALGTTSDVVAAFDAALAMYSIQKGNHPRILILSGMHGDEYEVIDYVSRYISAQSEVFPDFLYIPKVSPTAVTAKSRVNAFGHDLNRSFTSPITDPEVRDCVNTISRYTYSLCLDFHEDPDLTNEFYMYDTGLLRADTLLDFQARIQSTGVSLFNGMDDPNDLTLCNTVIDGYIPIHIDVDGQDSGFSSGWAIRHGITKRYMTFEIPGKSSHSQKIALIQAIFSFFLRPEFMVQ